mgnify:CR=1 FL=1
MLSACARAACLVLLLSTSVVSQAGGPTPAVMARIEIGEAILNDCAVRGLALGTRLLDLSRQASGEWEARDGQTLKIFVTGLGVQVFDLPPSSRDTFAISEGRMVLGDQSNAEAWRQGDYLSCRHVDSVGAQAVSYYTTRNGGQELVQRLVTRKGEEEVVTEKAFVRAVAPAGVTGAAPEPAGDKSSLALAQLPLQLAVDFTPGALTLLLELPADAAERKKLGDRLNMTLERYYRASAKWAGVEEVPGDREACPLSRLVFELTAAQEGATPKPEEMYDSPTLQGLVQHQLARLSERWEGLKLSYERGQGGKPARLILSLETGNRNLAVLNGLKVGSVDITDDTLAISLVKR